MSNEREIRLVAALTAWGDEAALYNAFSSGQGGSIVLVGRVTHLAQLEDQVKTYQANVVLIDHQIAKNTEGEKALADLIQRLRHNPEYPIITFGVIYDPKWTQVFEQMGALGHITGPIGPQQIEDLRNDLPVAIQIAYQERLRPDYIQRFSDSALRIIDSGAWQRHQIAIWSTKGGVGKTFVSREFAVALGALADRRTLLIDADMNCGKHHLHLPITANRNLYSLATVYKANRNTLSPKMIQEHLQRYQATNLYVLPGVYDMTLGGAEVLNGPQGEEFANALMDTVDAMGWDFVVWDLGQSYFVPMHLVPLKRASLILVIVTAEKATAITVELALDGLRKEIAIEPERFRLLINMWDESLGLSARELVERTKLPEFARIPYDSTLSVHRSLNYAKPIVLDRPTPISDAIISAVAGIYRPISTIWEKRGGSVTRERKPVFPFIKR